MSTIQKTSVKFNRFKDSLANFSFALPAILIFSVFYIYPFVDVFHLSMHEWDGIQLTRYPVGFDNFKELFTDKLWWDSVGHAGYITLIALTFQNFLAFGLAMACDREIRFKKVYRVIFFLPPVLSEIVVGLIWTWILSAGMQDGQHIGLLNFWLDKIGLHHLVNDWLSDPKTALTCIAIVHSWKGFGWGFIMMLAGLQTIDSQLYEAAKVDGAGAWNQFRHVTIPMMMPVLLVVVILTILGSMQAFVLIMAMVQQGLVNYTDVPVTQILASMTGIKRFGYACAQGVTFGALLIMVSFTFKLLSSRVKQA